MDRSPAARITLPQRAVRQSTKSDAGQSTQNVESRQGKVSKQVARREQSVSRHETFARRGRNQESFLMKLATFQAGEEILVGAIEGEDLVVIDVPNMRALFELGAPVQVYAER